ncbi:MAG: TonB-dependent receptor [Bacteroidota bacterium]
MRISTHVKCLCLFVLSLLLSIGGYAQDKTVSGTVTDGENNETLPGVNVLIKGTTQGTVTDMNGEYRLSVPGNDAVLVFTSIGYAAEEVTVGNQSTIDLTMLPDVQSLSEIVVTGYSVDNRRETTGSVATVDAEDLQVVPSGNVEQQLQGRVSGVTVITNGQPGTSSIVRVRGFGALGGNEPLYVVDGVPTLDTEFLAPGDIESTTVLKDATSASIYGARAAGGVIVYTTKKGGRNQPLKVTYNGEIGVTDPGQGLEVLNPEEQAIWTWNAIRNGANNRGEAPNFTHPQYGTGAQPIIPDYLLVGPDAGIIGNVNLDEQAQFYNVDPNLGSIYQVVRANQEGTDWYDAITRPGMLHRHNLGLSGGGENNRYYLGLNMQEQEGILNYQVFKRYTVRANSEFDIIPNKLRIGENIQGTFRSVNILLGANNRGQGGAGSADDENLILTASRMSPIIPIFDEFGGYAGTAAPGFNNPRNPVADLDGQRNNSNFSVGGFGNVYLEFEPIEDLTFRSSFGGSFESFNAELYTRRQYENSENNSAFGYTRRSFYETSWVFTNTVSYKKEFGDHGFDVLLGQEALNQGSFNFYEGTGIDPFSETPDFITLNTVEANPGTGFKSNGVNFASYFGSVKYDFRDKYLLTGVVRYDGSSRFGSEERFGIFPAISGAWRISSEGFMDGLTFIEDMKIRGGYGIIGNSNNVDPNNQFSLYTTNLGQGSYDINGTNSAIQLGFYRNRIGNPFARWEQAVTINAGFDALLFNGKLDVIFDVWEKRTQDLLFEVPVTLQTGNQADAPSVNVGEMLNRGIDLRIVNKGTLGGGLSYEVTLNGGFLQNEIVALAPGIEELPNRTEYRGIIPVLNRLGQPLSNFYGYEVEGIFQDQNEVDNAPTQEGAAPGRFRFADLDGDGEITIDDRTNLGNPIPDFTGGLTIKLSYKGFDLEAYTYGQAGNEIYNISKLFTDFYPLFPGAAISSRVKDTWTPQNTGAEIPIFEDVSNFSTNTQSNSFYVEDGSYLRMQNLTFGYNLPASTLDNWGMEKLRVFASVNNLFTITGYDGLDPQVGGGADTNFGIDRGNFPVTRQFVFGVNVAF